MICQSCGSKNVRWNMYEEKECVECSATGDKLRIVVCACGYCTENHWYIRLKRNCGLKYESWRFP